jgi:hypothetical protein
MRPLLQALLLAAAFVPAAAHAGTVTSTEVSNVSVTIYRDPQRGQGAMDRNWPGGYALISETRTIRIPAGESVVRFEGVAEGLLPETAIVTGLPRGVREKNRDARLISPAGLVDAYLKRAVLLTRTNPETGKVTKQQAIIQAGPNGGVILQTPEGVEALGCAGLPERMIYNEIPDGLAAKPTLSVLTSSNKDVTVTIQLSYLAQGFDWSANYVARMQEDGGSLGLFSWLTVANGGSQSFTNASLQVIAGRLNKGAAAAKPVQAPPALALQCWPADITSTYPRSVWNRMDLPPGFDLSIYDDAGRNSPNARRLRKGERFLVQAVPAPMVMMDMAMAPAPPPAPPPPVIAKQEELGDLKLYRVPIRVTVAAQSQKQVAMLNQPKAQVERIYSANVNRGSPQPQAMPFLLRTKNVKEKGLGLPLPAGQVALFENARNRSLLVGEQALDDRAVGDEVELSIGQSPDVTWTLTRALETGGKQVWRAEIVNARDVPLKAEIIVPYETNEKPEGLERRGGGWALPLNVPANDKAAISYTLK